MVLMKELRFRYATAEEITRFAEDAKIDPADFPHAFTPVLLESGCWVSVSNYLFAQMGMPELRHSERRYHPSWIIDDFTGRGRDWRVVVFFQRSEDALAFRLRWC
jgi:hypothetical protein